MFRRAIAVLALPPCLLSRSMASHSRGAIGVVGAPFNRGQRREGVSKGPQVIRDTGVLDHLTSLGLDVRDCGDVTDAGTDSEVRVGPDGERHHTAVLEYNRRLSAAVRKVVKEGRVCVTLGGDHSTAIGSVHGHAAANPANQVVVLWVDAHADINTGAASSSGNMHGMPAAYHMRALEKDINKLPDGWPQPCLDAHHLVYIGLRDVEPDEKSAMERLGVLSYGMREVDSLGFQNVVAASLAHLRPAPDRPLHVSFDIDVLDPLEAPSTGTPVRGGLSIRECLHLCEAVHDTGHLSAFDLVEVNPDLGSEDDAARTAAAARLVLLSVLASRRTA